MNEATLKYLAINLKANKHKQNTADIHMFIMFIMFLASAKNYAKANSVSGHGLRRGFCRKKYSQHTNSAKRRDNLNGRLGSSVAKVSVTPTYLRYVMSFYTSIC